MTEEPILGEITAAGIHIEWAIRLMIDRSAFVPALTLAGAADSLLEKIAKDRGLERTAHSEIAQSLNAKGYGVSEEIGKSMNGARNFLKHGELEPDFPKDADPIADIIRSRQWIDWRDLRFRDLRDSAAASAVAGMAKDIKSRIRRLESEISAERLARATATSTKGFPKVTRSKTKAAPKIKSPPPSELIAPSEPWSHEVPEVIQNGILLPARLSAMHQKPYYAFTKAYDEVVKASELATPEDLSRLLPYLNKHVAALSQQNLRPSKPFRKGTAVTLLLDNSGSLRGDPIAGLAAAANLLIEGLDARGARTEVLGYTTKAWKGGQSREEWLARGKPAQPGRLNDIRHIIYKSFTQTVREASPNLALMMREGLLKENIDGEALLWAQERIQAESASTKVIVMITDGAPVDDSTLSVNRASILEEHFRHMIKYVQSTSTKLVGIGIGHDINRYIDNSETVENIDNVSSRVKAVLDKIE